MGRLSRVPEKIVIADRRFEAVVSFFREQDDMLALYLYGSYETDYQNPLSDVDLAFLLMPGVEITYRRELGVNGTLAGLLGIDDVNAINLDKAPITLQLRVIDEGRLLYTHDEELLADFRELVVNRYCDFEPDLRRIYEDFDEGLRREFL